MIYFILGILFLYLGYSIKYKQETSLIIGYNTMPQEAKEKIDIASHCRIAGNMMFVLCGFIILAFAGELLKIDWLVSVGWLMFVFLAIGTILYLNNKHRFISRRFWS